MFLVLAAVSFINASLRAPVAVGDEKKDHCYIGVVTAEDPRAHGTKLDVDVKQVLLGGDTLPLGLPAEFYFYSEECLLGKTIVVDGRMRPSRTLYRPNLLTGRLIARDGRPSCPVAVFGAAAAGIDRLFRALFGATDYALSSSLVLGGSSRVGGELMDVFTRAGVLHILSVSGLHVGFIISFVGFIMIAAPVAPRFKLLAVIAAIFVYAGITGFRPSVVRAAAMASLFGLASALERDVDHLHILNVSALVILILTPRMLFDIGAQLSFASVYGIFRLLPVIQPFLAKTTRLRPVRLILSGMALSLCAQLFVSPLLIQYFNRTQLVAVFSNIIVIPLTSVITYGLFSAIIVGPVLLGAARLIAAAVSGLLAVLVAICRFFSSLPFASVSFSLPAVFSLLFYLLFFRRSRRTAVYLLLAMALLYSLPPLGSGLAVTITGGSHIVVATPDGRSIFIAKKHRNAMPGRDAFDYAVGDCPASVRMRQSVAWPDRWHRRTLDIGAARIEIDTTVTVRYGQTAVAAGPWLKQKDTVRYFFSNGRKKTELRINAGQSLVDRLVTECRILGINLWLLF